MDNEKLTKDEIIIRVCPATKKVVLSLYIGNDDTLDLHNDSVDDDIKEVLNFVKKYSK